MARTGIEAHVTMTSIRLCPYSMVNIPTELLRTLIAVVDLRSFTKAAQSLGITQPAVSAQIKRLQYLLGADLFDKSAPGVSLTSAGEMVVAHARRLLSINDQILDLATPRSSKQTLKIGMAGDFPVAQLALAVARFREVRNDVSFTFSRGTLDTLLRDLRESEIDILVGLSMNGPVRDTQYSWIEELVWVGAPSSPIDAALPLALVTYGEECLLHRIAVGALNDARRNHDLVYVGPSILGIASAAAAGLGFTVLPRGRAGDFFGLTVRNDQSLPPLPKVCCGIYTREGAGQDLREQLADLIAAHLRPEGKNSGRRAAAAEPAA